MGKWVLYTQPNYAHLKPAHLTPLVRIDGWNMREWEVYKEKGVYRERGQT